MVLKRWNLGPTFFSLRQKQTKTSYCKQEPNKISLQWYPLFLSVSEVSQCTWDREGGKRTYAVEIYVLQDFPLALRK